MSQTTFAQRLNQACDDSPLIPEFGKGRQVAIAKRIGVSQEAVRKWFKGEASPKQDKLKELAEYLEVDQAWLALGIKPEVDRNERRRERRIAEGAVHVLVGMVTIEGGHCAFPSERDPRSGFVDFYAIMRGTQLAVHVSPGREISKGRYEFIVPREYQDVRCVGFIAVGPGRFHLLDLSTPLIDEHRQRKAGDYSITVNLVDGKYVTGLDTWPRVRTFGEIV